MKSKKLTSDRAAKGKKKREKKDREKARRWAVYRTIPQTDWVEMSGRQPKVLNEQAERYGIPFGNSPVDLPAVAKALHEFLKANATRLAAVKRDGGAEELSLSRQIKQTKLEQEQAKLAEMRGQLVRLEKIQQQVMMVFAGIGRGIEMVRQQVGIEPLRPLVEEIEFQRVQWARAWRSDAGGGE